MLHIQLNRPNKRNALNDEMFDELVAVAERARDNTEFAAIVVSGAGQSFCAGMDFSLHQTYAAESASGQRSFAESGQGNAPYKEKRI